MTTIEFRAPWGRTVRVRTKVGLVIVAVIVLSAAFAPMDVPLAFRLAAIVVPLLIVAASLARTVRGYTLTEEAIIVQRGWGETRLPLAGLRSVTGEVDAMRGSMRLTGNDGFFSITGWFWNRKLGRHRAFATDLSRAVVLRYADRTIVITPHDPQQFIMRAGTFIRIAGFPR
jgi:Bacterial PH domain